MYYDEWNDRIHSSVMEKRRIRKETGMRYSLKSKCSMVMVLALSSSMILAGCGSEESETTEVQEVVVEMQQAESGNLTLKNSFVGSISPQEQVYVIPFASGTVTEVNYNVGDYVNAGDVLFRIDDEGALLQLEQAQLSATSARQQVDMTLGSTQASADLQLESATVQAQSGYEQAQIAYYQTADALDDVEDAIEETESTIEVLKKNYAAASVSGGDAAAASALKKQLEEAQKALGELEAKESTLENSLLQVESSYRAAIAGLDISEKSKELTQGAIRQDTKEQTQTSLAMAQLGVDSAELALSYYTVTAPISGVIQSRNVEVNGMAASSNPAFVIANENSMTVTFQVSESVKNTLNTGDEITVERNGEEFVGHITEVGVAVNQQTGLFQVKASVEADGDVLPSGVSVKITADTYKAENAILIPYDAVYYDTEGSYVYLCVDGKAAKTYVTTDIFDDTTIAIVEGISVGDTVITTWSPRLLNGVEVTTPDSVIE